MIFFTHMTRDNILSKIKQNGKPLKQELSMSTIYKDKDIILTIV